MNKNKKINSRIQIKKDLQKLKVNKQFLTILILLFVSIFFWIATDLISSQSKEEVSKELTDLSKPLTPSFDKDILLKIQKKHSYSKEELSSFVIYKVLTSRDGKTEKVVPLEVTIDDIDPKPTAEPAISKDSSSLLQTELEIAENDIVSESTESGIPSEEK